MSRSAVGRIDHDTAALLLRRVPFGESDLVVQLLTEELGRVSALARGARRSQRRFASGLEPLHTLRVRLEERPARELLTLTEVRLEVVRAPLVADLDRMQVAGRALGWVRDATPARVREPTVWSALAALLDDLAAPGADAVEPTSRLAAFGFELLACCGWALELTRCVACGAPCPAERAALVDARRGGVVCRACGGARTRLSAAARAQLTEAAAGRVRRVPAGEAALALGLVEAALAAHLGVT